jgi:hypothetical protein
VLALKRYLGPGSAVIAAVVVAVAYLVAVSWTAGSANATVVTQLVLLGVLLVPYGIQGCVTSWMQESPVVWVSANTFAAGLQTALLLNVDNASSSDGLYVFYYIVVVTLVATIGFAALVACAIDRAISA